MAGFSYKYFMVLPLITLVIAICISAISGYVSILGMQELFPGGNWIIVAMMAAAEVGKIVTATWLHTNWKSPLSFLHRTYLVTALLILMCLTSMGLFGFLSASHLTVTQPVAGLELQINQIEQKINQAQLRKTTLETKEKQLDQSLNAFINVAKNRRGAVLAQKTREGQKAERMDLESQSQTLDQTIDNLSSSLIPLKTQLNAVMTKIGPIKYVADMLGWRDIDAAIRIVILMILFAFDPLAIILVISAMMSFPRKPVETKPVKPVPIEPQIELEQIEKLLEAKDREIALAHHQIDEFLEGSSKGSVLDLEKLQHEKTDLIKTQEKLKIVVEEDKKTGPNSSSSRFSGSRNWIGE